VAATPGSRRCSRRVRRPAPARPRAALRRHHRLDAGAAAPAAEVALAVPAEAAAGQPVAAGVRVTNLSGHKLPTGYPEGAASGSSCAPPTPAAPWLGERRLGPGHRRALRRRRAGQDLPLRARHLERNGTAGCDVEDAGGDPIFHFVLNDCIRLDNRIPPAGFTGGADLELRPVRLRLSGDLPRSGILVHWDDTSYALDLPRPRARPSPSARGCSTRPARRSTSSSCATSGGERLPPTHRARRQPPMVSSAGSTLRPLDPVRPLRAVRNGRRRRTVYLLLFRGDFETGDTSQWSVSRALKARTPQTKVFCSKARRPDAADSGCRSVYPRAKTCC